jgi:tetratricopeptide (TPR) repeat protein
MHFRFFSPCLALFAVCAVSCGKDPEVAKREYLKSGDEYMAADKLGDATIEYRNAVQQDPRFAEARLKLAEALLRNGDAAGAYREFIRAADLLPRSITAQVKAATMNLAAQQFEEALARVEKALAIDAQHADALILKANALGGLKRHDEAIAVMQAAIAADPKRGLSHSNLGALQLAAGRTEEAEESYRKALDVDPRSAVARIELAMFEWRKGRMDRAETVLQEALAIDANNVLANRLLASLYLSTKRPEKAENPLRTIAESTRESAARLMLADYYQSTKRIPEALAVLDSLAQDPKGFVAASTRKAVILYGQGQKERAHAAVDAALAREGKNVNALLVKADLLAAERNREAALKMAEAAVAADASSAAAHFAVGRARQALGNTEGAIAAFNQVVRLNPKAVAAQLELSRSYLTVGRPRDTLAFAEDVLAAQPGNADALLLQARALMGIGDIIGAERPTALLVRGYPSTSIVHVQLGDLHRKKGDVAAARAAYTRALAIDPLSVEALSGLAAIDVSAGKGADARARVAAALAKRPDSARLVLLAGQIDAQVGDLAAAERAYRRVVELDPANDTVYDLLGRLYQAQGRTEQAIAEFDRLAQRLPKPASVHTFVGTLLESQNRMEEARHRYEQALGIDPHAAIAANNLAYLIAEHGGNLDVALQLAQTAKANLPDSPAVDDTLGWVYYKKGLFDQAVTALKGAVVKEPKVAAFQYHLGLSSAKAKNGDVRLARQSLETALKLDPKASEANAARAALSELGGL